MICKYLTLTVTTLFISISAMANKPGAVIDINNYKNFPEGLENSHFFKVKSSYGLRPQREVGVVLSAPSFGGQERDCKTRIKSLMCLVDPGYVNGKRVCLEGGKDYAIYFEELYDFFPEPLQRVFCTLNTIFIEKSFQGTAYAGNSSEDGSVIMGIRKSVIDEKLSLQKWSSWKEQLSFGGITDKYETRAHLPETIVSQVEGLNDLLYFVIAHEFGHILDFANLVNKYQGECPESSPENPDPECTMDESSWGGIGWVTDKKPKVENEFENRAGLCFYWCYDKPLSPVYIPALYQDLITNTDFISIYATTQPWDDFADSLAYFLLQQKTGQSYEIETKQGRRYNIMEKLRSPLFAKKYEYIDQFLKRTDLKYK